LSGIQSQERVRGVRAVDRTLRILSLFATQAKVECNLEEIATGVELPKSTTHRLLETLIAQRFVELGTRHGTYRLGLRAAVVGNTAMQSRRPNEEVHAMLCAAALEIREGVGLSMLEGTDAVIIDRATSPRLLQWNLAVGGSLPAHQAAAGKVLLSGTSDEQIRRLYGSAEALPRATARTVVSVDELLLHVRRVRRDGFAVDDEELEVGLRCVAVPVLNTTGRLTHALGISVPGSRTSVHDLLRLVPPLQRTAAAISPFVTLVPRNPTPFR
jgi:DNA-binding IclR family transcriptional regulator